jgi:hypothetical protein
MESLIRNKIPDPFISPIAEMNLKIIVFGF